jgi:hypothetical protein
MSWLTRMVTGIGLIAVLLVSTMSSAFAATNAYETKFITSITYMNIGSDPAELSLVFYNAADGTTETITMTNSDGSARVIPANASASLAVSSISTLSSTWKGGAVVTSTQPLIATLVQVANDSLIRVRPVSNGFGASNGGNTVIIPTVLKTCFADKLTTRFNIQNVSGSSASVTLTTYWPNGTVSYTNGPFTLASGAVKAYDMGTISPGSVPNGVTLPTGCAFNGSAIITSNQPVVATALEASTINRYANSFEGFASTAGANKVYMPSAMCSVDYGDGAQSTAYAIQNVTGSSVTATVKYYYKVRTGNTLGSAQDNTSSPLSVTIPAFGKASVPGCDGSKAEFSNVTGTGMPISSVGSAVIESSAANSIVAVGKVVGAGITAASPGLTAGGTTINVPYVRYSTLCFTPVATSEVCRNEPRQRTMFAVQNLGATAATVTMTLYDHTGTSVGTATSASIPAGGKVSMSPANVTAVSTAGTPASEFGYWVVDGNLVYAGSATFTSSASIGVTVRVLNMTPLGQAGEDYNGIPE